MRRLKKHHDELDLIVVTHPDEIPGEVAVITEMFENGLHALHVRKPTFSKSDMKTFLGRLPAKYLRKVVLHSHHSLAFSYRVKGIHFKEKDRKKRFLTTVKILVFRLTKRRLHISTSFHKLREIKEHGGHFSYAFFSPVFESISKHDHKPKFTLSMIMDGISEAATDVYALGGVDESKIDICKELGFYGVAVLGSVWDEKDPVSKFLTLKNQCRLHPDEMQL